MEILDKDQEEIIKLLEANNLPNEDIISSNVEFSTIKSDGKIIGCIGIEKYGEDVLVRSFVVAHGFKNHGIGTQLLKDLQAKCQIARFTKMHLLTTTAEAYFSRKGFIMTERAFAPNGIAGSKEFSKLCPSSSVYMTKIL